MLNSTSGRPREGAGTFPSRSCCPQADWSPAANVDQQGDHRSQKDHSKHRHQEHPQGFFTKPCTRGRRTLSSLGMGWLGAKEHEVWGREAKIRHCWVLRGTFRAPLRCVRRPSRLPTIHVGVQGGAWLEAGVGDRAQRPLEGCLLPDDSTTPRLEDAQ